MTQVKICGLTRREDVALASALGAAAVGLNFVGSSPRRVTVERARSLAEAAGAGVMRVGVFADEDRGSVLRAVAEVPLDLLQLHRRVTADDVTSLGVPIVAAVRPEDGPGGMPEAAVLGRCRAVLWDSSAGTGRRLDERLAPPRFPIPVFVAGGLDPENVGEVIRRLRPAGVDVASGVESAPGIKDPGRMERFFAAVRDADRAGS